ncbi:MAG TPA: type II toxin-antitoxin system ParD family antitoxin [Longimicrobium sp.]|nr:type II toxin-antitoxin system ParD family antitoxin [Longimicrobium sp.]
MNVSLTPELERLVERKVESGEYKSASEVVRQALRLLAREEEEYQARLEALRAEIQLGIDDFDNGRHAPMEEVFAELRAERRRGAAV